MFPTVATAKGHLNEERQNTQSTKPNDYESTLKSIKSKFTKLRNNLPKGKSFKNAVEEDILSDFFPPSPIPNIKSRQIIHAIVDLKELIAYADLTGKFPYKSSRGNQYILVAYNFDANHIRGVPLKNREATTIKQAYEQLHEYFEKGGVKPSTWILDNEFSNELKVAFQKSEVNYQLVPPKTHRSNAAERAIQTYKNHFKAGLAQYTHIFQLENGTG